MNFLCLRKLGCIEFHLFDFCMFQKIMLQCPTFEGYCFLIPSTWPSFCKKVNNIGKLFSYENNSEFWFRFFLKINFGLACEFVIFLRFYEFNMFLKIRFPWISYVLKNICFKQAMFRRSYVSMSCCWMFFFFDTQHMVMLRMFWCLNVMVSIRPSALYLMLVTIKN
jgi:hypothetical protein